MIRPGLANLLLENLASPRRNKRPKLLVQHSSGNLANVLAQHLFTSFIWTIIRHLPADVLHQGSINIHKFVQVQSSNAKDLQSSTKGGLGLELSHTKLTGFVKYSEGEGLGTSDEILLCMIPGFSFGDLLPNDAVFNHFVPKDTFGSKREDWIKSCAQYNAFLNNSKNVIKAEAEGHFGLTTIVDTMEFVYLMGLDLLNSDGRPSESDFRIVVATDGQKKRRPRKLGLLLQTLSERFPHILKRLSPIYDLQRRRPIFEHVFRLFKIKNSDSLWSPRWSSQSTTTKNKDYEFLYQIGFRTRHFKLYYLEDNSKVSLADLTRMYPFDLKGNSSINV